MVNPWSCVSFMARWGTPNGATLDILMTSVINASVKGKLNVYYLVLIHLICFDSFLAFHMYFLYLARCASEGRESPHT